MLTITWSLAYIMCKQQIGNNEKLRRITGVYMGIFQSLTVCIYGSCLHDVGLMYKYLHMGIPICITGSPYTYGCESPKKVTFGDPHLHATWLLYACSDQNINLSREAVYLVAGVFTMLVR